MKIDEIEVKKDNKKVRRFGKMIPIMAVLLAILAVSAVGYGIARGAFYHDAFGEGIKSVEGGLIDEYDADGNLVKTVKNPAQERVEIDPELADEMIGENVVELNQTTEFKGYTITIKDVVFDDNGIGVVTVDIDNPDGHELHYGDRNEVYKTTVNMSFTPTTNSDDIYNRIKFTYRALPITESYTETHASMVFYVVPMDASVEKGDVYLDFEVMTPLGRSLDRNDGEAWQNYSEDEIWDEVFIPVSTGNRTGSRIFTDGTYTASVSPVGVKIYLGTGNFDETVAPNEMTIVYNDGEEYVVRGEDVLNTTVGGMDGDGNVWEAFNRLCRVDDVAEICIVNDYYGISAVLKQ